MNGIQEKEDLELTSTLIELYQNRICMKYFRKLFNEFHIEQYEYLQEINFPLYTQLKRIFHQLYKSYIFVTRKCRILLRTLKNLQEDQWQKIHKSFGYKDYREFLSEYNHIYNKERVTLEKFSSNVEKLITFKSKLDLFAVFEKKISQIGLNQVLINQSPFFDKDVYFQLCWNEHINEVFIDFEKKMPISLEISLQIINSSSNSFENSHIVIFGDERISHLIQSNIIKCEFFQIVPNFTEFSPLLSFNIILQNIDISQVNFFVILKQDDIICKIQKISLKLLTE